jgi:hypothetical protein
MSEFHFNGKVVAVTAGSSSLGQGVILELLSKGASVVALVSAQITANCQQFFEIESFVKHLENLPKVDVLINLMSFLKTQKFEDCFFGDVEDAVRTAFKTCKAVWKMMRKHKHGHILYVLPDEYFYFEQSEGKRLEEHCGGISVVGSVATLAWQGLVNSLKREGAKFNIRTNTLVYRDGSQNDGLLNDCTIPVALFMTHNSFKDSGVIIEVSSSRISRIRIERGSGKLFNLNFTAEEIPKSIHEISSLTSNSDYPVAYSESLLKVFFLNVLGKPRL